jgi:hypothetical protein
VTGQVRLRKPATKGRSERASERSREGLRRMTFVSRFEKAARELGTFDTDGGVAKQSLNCGILTFSATSCASASLSSTVLLCLCPFRDPDRDELRLEVRLERFDLLFLERFPTQLLRR